MHIKGSSIISTIKNILLFHINHQIITTVIYLTLYAAVAPSIIGAEKAGSLFPSFIDTLVKKHPFLFILIYSPTLAKPLFDLIPALLEGDPNRAEQEKIDSILKMIKNSPYR